MNTGRFAPSPTGRLHVGNLRTAVAAFCSARRVGGRFLIRMEDLTTEKVADAEARQLADLELLGMASDAPVVRSSERMELYNAAIERLSAADLTYPCFCSRREIREAVAAPHGGDTTAGYPGTCADLDTRQRARRAASGRPPALRLRAGGALVEVRDELGAHVVAEVDDFVLQRGDGLPAYNLAVVLDDAEQGVDQVVRGADLLETTPRQVLLAGLLDLAVPSYFHVPLVFGPDGERLSKRHGAVTLGELGAMGVGPRRLLGMFAQSFGIASLGGGCGIGELCEQFEVSRLDARGWVFDPAELPGP